MPLILPSKDNPSPTESFYYDNLCLFGLAPPPIANQARITRLAGPIGKNMKSPKDSWYH